MKRIFTTDSPYRKRARSLAILWTLLIFILCFIPGYELPDVKVPMIDKWAHLVLFGIFTFLWLCAHPSTHITWLGILMMITVFIGWLVEYVQGHYIQGRTQDNADTLMDAIGGLAGILIFSAAAFALKTKLRN